MIEYCWPVIRHVANHIHRPIRRAVGAVRHKAAHASVAHKVTWVCVTVGAGALGGGAAFVPFGGPPAAIGPPTGGAGGFAGAPISPGSLFPVRESGISFGPQPEMQALNELPPLSIRPEFFTPPSRITAPELIGMTPPEIVETATTTPLNPTSPTTPIPEPSSLAILAAAIGLAGLFVGIGRARP